MGTDLWQQPVTLRSPRRAGRKGTAAGAAIRSSLPRKFVGLRAFLKGEKHRV